MALRPTRRVLDDPRFGAVTIRVELDGWHVEGPRLGGGTSIDRKTNRLHTPLGDGEVDTSIQFMRRRSSDVRLAVPGRRYHWHHTSRKDAELRRDDRVVGRFTGTTMGTTFATPVAVSHYDLDGWADDADATDAGVGHVCAARYGAGAFGVVGNLLSLWPG